MEENAEIENERKKKIQEHKETLKKTIDCLDNSKTDAQEIVKDGKELCQYIDQTKDNVEKELKVVSNLPEVVPYMNDGQWAEYRRLRRRSEVMAGSTVVLAEDIARNQDQVSDILATAGSFASGTASETTSAVNTFITIDQSPFQAKLKEIEVEDTTPKNIEIIKRELSAIKPETVKDFDSVIKDWSSTGDPDLKYKSLLSLRSVLCDQFLKDKCPASQYSRTTWFQGGKEKYCQTKFLILGFNDLQSIPSSTLMRIENLSQDFQRYFGDMSEYGKKAERSTIVENVFKESLATFSEVLMLRKQFYRPSA